MVCLGLVKLILLVGVAYILSEGGIATRNFINDFELLSRLINLQNPRFRLDFVLLCRVIVRNFD